MLCFESFGSICSTQGSACHAVRQESTAVPRRIMVMRPSLGKLPRDIGCLTAAFETAILYSSSVTPPTRAFTEFYGIMFTYLGVFCSVLLILDCQMFALVCVYFIINGVSYLHSP